MQANKFSIAFVSALLVFSVEVAAQDKQSNDIIVTAKANATSGNLAASVEVIDREDIANSGADSVVDVLKSVAGFSWTANSSSSNGRRNIGIRGMDSEHILVLIDGERVTETDSFIGHSNFKLSFVDINSVERIEIIKGGGSALYGSEAVGGVINIITKLSDNKYRNRLSIGASTLSKRSGGSGKNIAFASYFGDHNTSVNANISATGADVVKKPDGTLLFEEQKNKNIALNISHKFNSDNKISINLFDGEEQRNIIDAPYYDISRKKYSLAYQTKFNKLNTKFKIYDNKTDAGFHGFGASPYFTHKVEDRIFSAELFGDITNNQYLTVGAEQHKQSYLKDYSNPATDDYKAKSTTQKSLYAQDTISLGSGTVIAGLRLDDNSQFGNGTSSQLGYVHNLTNNKKLKFNYSTAFKTPNIKEADSNYSFSRGHPGASVFVGNSNLKPETSNNLEIALTGKSDVFDYSAAIYKTKLTDMIIPEDTGATTATGGNINRYENIDKVTVQGLEVSTSFDLSKTMFLDASYTHLKTDTGNGGELSFRPKNTLKIKLNKEFDDTLNANISVNYNGKSVDGDKKVSNYTIYDFAFNKKLDKNAKLQFAIDNFMDEKLDSGNHITELPGREYKLNIVFDF